MRRPLSSCLRLLAVLLLFTAGAAWADDDFLDPEVAFKLSARTVGPRTVELTYTIVPGYYLYRDRLEFQANGATLDPPLLPPGKTKFDETLQKTVETYRDVLRIPVVVQQGGSVVKLLATNQGCADKGLCYPPQQRAIEVRLAAFGGDGGAKVLGSSDRSTESGPLTAATSGGAAAPVYSPDDAGIEGALRSGKLWVVAGVFFAAGVLLSLTPCVLPMLPILSSIIVGQAGHVSRGRGLALAASYSLGMALVYTGFGVAAGLAGQGLAAELQKPWVLALFAAGLIALALSMFGAFELQLPSALTSRLAGASGRLPAGRLAGVCAMGGLSALIVSPCVVAPLAGALVFLSQTRDVWMGGTALFTLAAGMSVPLLLMGASAEALLPRVGAWMEDVKRVFGVLLLGVALWTVQSVLPASVVLLAWGVLALTAGMLVSAPPPESPGVWTRHPWRRVTAVVLAVGGVLQLVGAAAGGTDPLRPLAPFGARGADGANGVPPGATVAFQKVRSVEELDGVLRTAGRPVMLDFYADWCVSCKEMERYTFVDPAVQKRLGGALVLRADVTANNPDDRALLKRYQLFGPPGTVFFDAQGREIAKARITGFQDSARFLETLSTAGL